MTLDITQISNDIVQKSKNGNFKLAFDLYGDINHPVICYYLGLYAYNNDYDSLARKKFIQGAKFGLTYPNDFTENLHSNSIGQCIFLLLEKNLLGINDSQKIMRLIGLSYAYLSISINIIGNKAYQSHESRAKLLSIEKYSDEAASIMNSIGVEDVGFPLIVAYDFYESYLGYASYLFKSETPYTDELRNKGMAIFTEISKSFRDKPSLEDLRDSGKKLHKTAFHKVKALLEYANELNDKNFLFI